jgi:hypothetical protein
MDTSGVRIVLFGENKSLSGQQSGWLSVLTVDSSDNCELGIQDYYTKLPALPEVLVVWTGRTNTNHHFSVQTAHHWEAPWVQLSARWCLDQRRFDHAKIINCQSDSDSHPDIYWQLTSWTVTRLYRQRTRSTLSHVFFHPAVAQAQHRVILIRVSSCPIIRAYLQLSKSLEITKMSKIWCLISEIWANQNGNGRVTENPECHPEVQNSFLFAPIFLERWVMKVTNAPLPLQCSALRGILEVEPKLVTSLPTKIESWWQKSERPIFGLQIRSIVIAPHKSRDLPSFLIAPHLAASSECGTYFVVCPIPDRYPRYPPTSWVHSFAHA